MGHMCPMCLGTEKVCVYVYVCVSVCVRVCACIIHVGATRQQKPAERCTCITYVHVYHLCLRPCTCAHVPTCRQWDSTTRQQHWHKGARLAWVHRLHLHEHGTHTCVFLPPVTQLVSFQRIQLGKDSC